MRSDQLPFFSEYIGIDYSGAETPTASLKGLRVYRADEISPPIEVTPPPSPRKYWTRRGIAQWLVQRLSQDTPTLVGIDHGFSFPLRHLERMVSSLTGPLFLTISNSIGRLTTTTPMSISCATASAEWRRPDRQRPLATID